MTRKEAVTMAIDLVKSTNDYSEKERTELMSALENIKRTLPLVHWTEASIFDAIDQHLLEHGKLPNLSDFTYENNLPTKTVIRRVFGLKISDFLSRYYKSERLEKVKEKKKYSEDNKELLEEFELQYRTLQCTSCKDYDRRRKNDTPCSRTLLRRLNMKTWNELLTRCGIKINGYNSHSIIRPSRDGQKLSITRNHLDSSDEYKKEVIKEISNYMLGK